MRIGYDAKRLFTNFSGLGNYSRTLVANLAAHYPDVQIQLFTPKVIQRPRTQEFIDNPRYEVFEGGGAAWRTWSISRDINEHRLDIYHGLSHEIPFSSQRVQCKMVVTMHDVIHKTRARDYSAIDRLIYERKCKYACAHADAIIAISEHTRQDIMKYYKVPGEKIRVIYQSCDPQFGAAIAPEKVSQARQLFSLPDTYFLYVGSVIPRKNLMGIIHAIKSTPKRQRRPLVVIGGGRSYFGKVVKKIEKAGLQDMVHFLGDVPFELFPAIYSQAIALIYPSHYEGFGIPVIEALSVGLPVITSEVTSLPEAGGDAALLVDPKSTEAIRDAMLTLCDPAFDRAGAIAAGTDHVRKFAADKVTGDLMALY
ncbi:MAG: glycosyltransferase family 1 protein, partial [Saprospiraceae bacterium]|nr:glycosyltransferase family 1 protein [Saprospiraceae bacterium]